MHNKLYNLFIWVRNILEGKKIILFIFVPYKEHKISQLYSPPSIHPLFFPSVTHTYTCSNDIDGKRSSRLD